MKILAPLLLTLAVLSCSKTPITKTYAIDDSAELGQLIGSAMVAIDELGGSVSGDISKSNFTDFGSRAFVRLNQKPETRFPLVKMSLPFAYAGDCITRPFGFCALTTNQESRTLSTCTTAAGINMATGNVTLTFTGTGAVGNGANSCTIPLAGDAVTSLPRFSVRGSGDVVFSESATTTGLTLTRASATTFTFVSHGIQRSFRSPENKLLLDMTSSTATDITVDGVSRNGRTLTAGSLLLQNNLSAVSCTIIPTAVAWSANCNCPTAGSWSGACSDSTSLTLAFGSTCGQAVVTKGTDNSTIALDRCDSN